MPFLNKSFFLLSFLFLFTPSNIFGQKKEVMIIAHRGGVVNEKLSENSFGALEEAISRGYTHVEVDVRMSKDGKLVCFHNDRINALSENSGRISKLTWNEIQSFKLEGSKEPIPSFEEYVERCKNRIGLMLDIKGCDQKDVEHYSNQIMQILEEHEMLTESLILINKLPMNNQEKIAEYFMGKCKVSWRKGLDKTIKEVTDDGEFSENYYYFNHASDFSKKTVDSLHSKGVKVIVSVNTQHYITNGIKQGKKDISKLLKWGVDGFQIDSVYDEELVKN